MKVVGRRLERLETRFAPPDQRPRRVYLMVLCRYGRTTSLANSRCTRTLCADGTVMEFVELEGSNDGPGRVTSEELKPVGGGLSD